MYYVQVDYALCESCYRGLRRAKSNRNKAELEKMETEIVENNQIIVQSDPENSLEKSSKRFPTDDEQDLPKIESLVGETSSSKIPLIVVPDTQSSEINSASSQSTITQNSQYSEYIPSDQEQKTKNVTFLMPINRVCASKGYCFICKKTKDLIEVPIEARLQIFSKLQILIPKRNRCCSEHIIKKKFCKYGSHFDRVRN